MVKCEAVDERIDLDALIEEVRKERRKCEKQLDRLDPDRDHVNVYMN